MILLRQGDSLWTNQVYWIDGLTDKRNRNIPWPYDHQEYPLALWPQDINQQWAARRSGGNSLDLLDRSRLADEDVQPSSHRVGPLWWIGIEWFKNRDSTLRCSNLGITRDMLLWLYVHIYFIVFFRSQQTYIWLRVWVTSPLSKRTTHTRPGEMEACCTRVLSPLRFL